jgi:hypothetical protein
MGELENFSAKSSLDERLDTQVDQANTYSCRRQETDDRLQLVHIETQRLFFRTKFCALLHRLMHTVLVEIEQEIVLNHYRRTLPHVNRLSRNLQNIFCGRKN